MGWPRRLVLVRHAESEGNIRTVEERTQFEMSTHEYPLTKHGIKQAIITGQYLKERFGEFDVYYVSYYLRSLETMAFMYPDAAVYEDPRLAEGQRGIWHILTSEQIDKMFPEEAKRKAREGPYHYRPWGGENWPDIELRIHSFLGTLNRDCDDQNVLIVAHGHWLILFQRLVEHFSIEEAVRRYQEGVFKNASVIIYEGQIINNKSRLLLKEQNIIPWEGKL